MKTPVERKHPAINEKSIKLLKTYQLGSLLGITNWMLIFADNLVTSE